MQVLWVSDDDTVSEYVAAQHIEADAHSHSLDESNVAYKFIYWDKDGGLLIVGGRKLETHDVLQIVASRRVADLPSGYLALGAGIINRRGKISHWHSLGFSVDTPQDLKPQLMEALGVGGEDMDDGSF